MRKLVLIMLLVLAAGFAAKRVPLFEEYTTTGS